MAKVTTAEFDRVNAQTDKDPILVLEIEGVNYVFSSAQVYTRIQYDDPDTYYDQGYFYDGLRPLDPTLNKPLIDRKGSSATISQKLEQWDGRASVETVGIRMVDYQQLITQICTPGNITDEILNKRVRIWFGYKEISYPQDYVIIFRGFINSISIGQGFVQFAFTDPSSKRKQTVFNASKTKLTQPLFGTKVVTFTVALSQVNLNSHGYSEGAEVSFAVENGSLPVPLVQGTGYYVKNATADSFQLSATVFGSVITLSAPPPSPVTPIYTVKNFDQNLITLASTTALYQTILNAKGDNDSTVTIGIVIGGTEICTYTNVQILNDTQINVERGQFGTSAVDHDIGEEVQCFISLSDNPLTISLKTMLSGWGGSPFLSNVAIRSIVNNDAGDNVPDSITFPQGIDVVRDYGLTSGDFLTISGDTIPTNNGLFTVSDILNENRTIVVEEKGILLQEGPIGGGNLAGVCSFNSQYDTYPVTAGLSMSPVDVFVNQWTETRQLFVPYTFTMNQVGAQTSAKEWIEKDLLRPLGAYSLTQNAQVSVGITHPPLVGDLSKYIVPENVINPRGVMVSRGLNNRFFYNAIRFNYNYNPLTDKYDRWYETVDADAIDRLQQVSVLEVSVKGLYDAAETETTLNALAERLLLRYKYAAETVDLSVFFGTGISIDAGDTVILTDTTPSTLQISNTISGDRGIYNRVMEVQERSVGISSGQTKLSLLSNNGFALTDRYAVIGPSSNLDPLFAHTPTKIKVTNSFFNTLVGTEYKKWGPYDGSWIKVFNPDFTIVGDTQYTQDLFDPNIMTLYPPLSFTPTSDMSIQFQDYDDSSANVNTLVKASFASLDPTAPILSGSTDAIFTLQSGYASRYQSGMIVYVMSPDGSRFSPDVKILNVIGDIVTVTSVLSGGANPTLGFTPQAGDLMQLGGFLDGGAGYRYF